MAPTKPPAPRHTVNRRLVIVSRVRPLCYLSLSGCRHTQKESIGIWLWLDSKRAEQKLARKRQTLAKESIYLPRARTNVVCASLYPRQRGAYKSPGRIGRGLRKESTAGCLHKKLLINMQIALHTPHNEEQRFHLRARIDRQTNVGKSNPGTATVLPKTRLGEADSRRRHGKRLPPLHGAALMN